MRYAIKLAATGALAIAGCGGAAYWNGSRHDGRVSPLYPEGCEPHMMLVPFPADRVGNWYLGPATAYHLRIGAS